jgi:hypothetical protein
MFAGRQTSLDAAQLSGARTSYFAWGLFQENGATR